MFFTLKELSKWFGMTGFEIWLHMVTTLTFSVCAVLKAEGFLDVTWWKVFIPLFACDGFNVYFIAIVLIRTCNATNQYRQAGVRFIWSLIFIVLLFIFKILLCQRLAREITLLYSEVAATLFIALIILKVRACQTS